MQNRTDYCVWCKKEIVGFRGELSAKEYNISGLCQECQDDTFTEEDEDLLDEALGDNFSEYTPENIPF